MMNYEDMKELDAVELNDAELEEVAGGKSRYIEGNTGKSHVRTGPGLDYHALGVLHVGEDAQYLGKTATDDRGVVWYKIRWNGRDAWVSSRYTHKIKY
ncbi:MAG: SH3 domain-containing protein [Clostridia bacterium]|nr:SH3 domain-containing protein [Clostridia bacterium]